jgi:hypothetical protein
VLTGAATAAQAAVASAIAPPANINKSFFDMMVSLI